MAITFRNVPAYTGAANGDIPTWGLSSFRVKTHTVSADGNVHETVHVFNSGLTTVETLFIVRHVYVPQTDQTRVSLRSVTQVEDSALASPIVGNYEAGIFWNHPGRFVLDVDALYRMIAATFFATTVGFGTAGVSQNIGISRLNRGITESPWT